MFDLTMETPLVLREWGETVETTLTLFFADNDLMSENDREKIMTALETNGEFSDASATIGGEWSLHIKNPR